MRQTWFGKLRRDGVLFAVVATLLFVANMFQPLAEANAAASPMSWSVCGTDGKTKLGPSAPVGADDCPTCIAGHPCASFSSAPASPTGFVAAWPDILLTRALVRPEAGASPVWRPASPKPGNRSPPPFA